MANHLKLHFILCLLSIIYFAAATVAEAAPELYHKPSHHSAESYEPQPQDFPNVRLYRAYIVIQSFKRTITFDPKNMTLTWTGNDICGETTYLGFYCAKPLGQDKELTVTAVLFNGFGLSAPNLRGFIDELPDLALFHAASNNFSSDIPNLTSLSYPYELSVSKNVQARPPATRQIVGGGSQTHGTLLDCVNVDLNFNFSITTPRKGFFKGFGRPAAMNSKALLLNHNSISGPLPANLGFSKLSYLALANNKLTGRIPQSIEHLQDSLLEVLLLNNQLSGCLPRELGTLHKAVVIDAGMNQLTGPIPSSFSCLNSVEQLNLAGNRLYGDIPDALCKLAGPAGRLANLTLSGNYFTSVGPACAALIKDSVLDVKNNCIPGLANQRRPAECAAFQSQPKTCPASTTQVPTCPAAAPTNAATLAERKARDYSSYVTYATLHE